MNAAQQLDAANPCTGYANDSRVSHDHSAELLESVQVLAAGSDPASHQDSAQPFLPNRPGLNDALGFLLGELEQKTRANGAAKRIEFAAVDDDDDNEEEELLGAFRALAPTVEAFLLESSGKLPSDPELETSPAARDASAIDSPPRNPAPAAPVHHGLAPASHVGEPP